MVVDEYESKENNMVIAEQDVISISQEHELFEGGQDSSDSSSIFSSEASLGAHTESEAHSVGFTSLSEEEQKGATNDPTTVQNRVNPPQESNDPLDKSSLISNEPRVASFGEDQGLMCASNESMKATSIAPSSSIKHDLVKNIGEEKVVGMNELQQDKAKSSVGNAKSLKPTLKRVSSSGSDTSSYSFAFPILAPGLPQRAPRRTEGINPQGRVSPSLDDPDLDGENSISRPKIRPPLQKKSLCCCLFCFPCHSIFSNCFKCSSSY